jgi:hypothetical protein
MRGQLLVIDGTPEAGALIRLLERDGFLCVQARGPIRVRTLLEEHPVELIVWKEERGNPELVRDLLEECARYPDIPIIHLFDRALPAPAVTHHPQIRESLPADAAPGRILSLLNQFFNRPQAVQAAPAAPKTELAFRNLISAILQRRRGPRHESPALRGEIHAPLTSVNVAERESLTGLSPPRPPSVIRRLLRWMRRRS